MTAAVAAAGAVRNHRAITAAVLGAIGSTFALVMAVVVVAMGGTPAPAEVAASLGIHPTVADAYQRAAETPEGTACGMRWQILAGVGRVESNHAAGSSIGADGAISPPIVGPVLDGRHGTARIADTDSGVLDGDTAFDRAVGPMQFLPSSWQRFGADGNSDGQADSNNIYDAAVAATRHLCASGAQLDDEEALRRALLAYNNSDTYVTEVLQWIRNYDEAARAGGSPGAAVVGDIVDVQGIRVDASIAASLDALLTAAREQGLVLTGGGYRTHDQQIALRRAHCGTSDYAIYEMPAGACSPPTARPGESQHERGLAIDFTCNGVLVARGDPCFAFLAANAASYGLANLPSEPWHWSTDGR